MSYICKDHEEMEKLCVEYYRTGKVEGYNSHIKDGWLTLEPIDPNGYDHNICIEGGHEE